MVCSDSGIPPGREVSLCLRVVVVGAGGKLVVGHFMVVPNGHQSSRGAEPLQIRIQTIRRVSQSIILQAHRLVGRLQTPRPHRLGPGWVRFRAILVIIISKMDPKIVGAVVGVGGIIGIEVSPAPVGAREDGKLRSFHVSARIGQSSKISRRRPGPPIAIDRLEIVLILRGGEQSIHNHLDGEVRGRSGQLDSACHLGAFRVKHHPPHLRCFWLEPVRYSRPQHDGVRQRIS